MTTVINKFNIRVYAIILKDQHHVLISDEYMMDMKMTKFPGGGLQFGEGTLDCLKREFMEELNLPIEIISHFYTTEFYQPTTLLPSDMQLLNIYYHVSAQKPYPFQTTTKRNDIPRLDGAQCFRWVEIDKLKEEDFTFPIDRFIIGEIIKWRNREVAEL